MSVPARKRFFVFIWFPPEGGPGAAQRVAIMCTHVDAAYSASYGVRCRLFSELFGRPSIETNERPGSFCFCWRPQAD